MTKDFIRKVRGEVVLEQKHQDGISHIVVGVFLVLNALLMSKGQGTYGIIFLPFVRAMISVLRKKFTYPRIGFAELGDRQYKQSNSVSVIGFFLVLLFGIWLYFSNHSVSPEWPKDINPYIGAGLTVGLLVLLAVVFYIERSKSYIFYGVALIALVAAIYFAKLKRGDVELILLVFGALDFVIGLILLRRFIRQYPVVNDEN